MQRQVRFMFASTKMSTLPIWVAALLCPIQLLHGATRLHYASATHSICDCDMESGPCDNQLCSVSSEAGGGCQIGDPTPRLPFEENCPPNCRCRLSSQPQGLPNGPETRQVAPSVSLGSHEGLADARQPLRSEGQRRVIRSGAAQEHCALFCRFLI